jgi:hypothetical protein
MESKCCYGEAIGTKLDAVEGEIFEGIYSLNAKIQKERSIADKYAIKEKKSFGEKIKSIQKFIKLMLKACLKIIKLDLIKKEKKS